MREKNESSSKAGAPGSEVARNLKWLSIIIFITAELAMSVTGIIYLSIGDINRGLFLTAFLIFTTLILVIVAAAYLYARGAWLQLSAGRSLLEEKMRESQERYRDLFQSSADGIVYTDNSGRVLECNQAFADMLGYQSEDLKGVTCRELTPADWHRVDQDIAESQMKNAGYSDEYMKEYLTREGSRLPVSVRVWVVYDGAGKPSGAWAMVRNMSERVQYENFMRETIVRLEQSNDRLSELDRLKTELVAMVSHELRAPLGAIESSLSAMRSLQPGGSPEEQEELIRILDRGVGRLTNLVDDLMDITRIESGQLKLEPRQADAVDLASRVVRNFEVLFATKGLRITLESLDGQGLGRFDPGRVEQVLTNLVDNALKFTDKGEVTVKVVSNPDNTTFSVADSGPGIPPEFHQKVFEKFFSLDAESRGGKQGVGLGLAISRGIVDAHGGRIWVESRKGGGTTFSFVIPNDTGA